MSNRVLLALLLLLQVACALFFVSDILSSLIGLRVQPLDWQLREFLEIAAAFGLVFGVAMGALMLRQSLRRTHVAEEKLRMASAAFMDLMFEKFSSWALTPAEQDVALFAIKGLSISEIALLRKTSEGTVKAQTNAIYRKANVAGRPQLLSLFIEDLIDDRP